MKIVSCPGIGEIFQLGIRVYRVLQAMNLFRKICKRDVLHFLLMKTVTLPVVDSIGRFPLVILGGRTLALLFYLEKK